MKRFWLCFVHGPTIAAKAVALPAGEDMEPGTWYYFDIAVDGEYDLTLTTLNDIVYTTDEVILFEDESTVEDRFAQTDGISLAAGRYYVKSSSAQTLSVAPDESAKPSTEVAVGEYYLYN